MQEVFESTLAATYEHNMTIEGHTYNLNMELF